MHHYYDDNGGGVSYPAPTPQPFTPPTPQGPVWEDPPPPPRKKHRRATVFFLVFLALIAIVVGGTLLWQHTDFFGATAFTAPPAATNPPMATQHPTTVARAPVGTGVTLVLQPPKEGQLTLQQVYQQTAPSIVSVRGAADDGYYLGTGVIMSEDGYIITNYHVIDGCSQVSITLQDETEYDALLVGGDVESDLAVLKIGAEALPPAPFGDSDLLQVGDVALAIGNPLGLELRGTMTDGIISAINRDVAVDGHTMVLLQTTAALNEGNSGGALLNQQGQVVGITNLKIMSDYSTIEGLGFAIPSVTTKTIVDELIAHGRVADRPTIGITTAALTPMQATQRGVPQGMWVESVNPKSGAYENGLRPGDVIVAAGGTAVHTFQALNAAKEGLQVGDTMCVTVYRDGAYFELSFPLMERYELEP